VSSNISGLMASLPESEASPAPSIKQSTESLHPKFSEFRIFGVRAVVHWALFWKTKR
jgi:hypothetical protein